MTDIWRSFVAQRCLWELGKGVVFHASEVFQDRNAHNLLKDFQDEIPGYLGNDRIRELLAAINLKGGQTEIPQNMLRCYEVLGGHGFLPPAELKLIEAWIHDVTSL